MTRVILAFFAVYLFATSAMAAPCIGATDSCTEWINVRSGPDRVMVYRTFPLETRNEAVSRALIVVHGAPRNADNYFRGATAAGFLAGALDDTLIISPRFASNSSDGCHDKLEVNEINWSCEGWRMGGDANGNSKLSSYDVIDRILALLSRRDVFPNLRHVVLAGHSAGGVFVHLYSITNQVHEKLPFALSYVVSNPSSYAYFDTTRPRDTDYATSARAPGFVPDPPADSASAAEGSPYPVFDDAKNCTRFNDWPYGLESRSGYTNRIPAQQIVAQSKARATTYLLGQLDILPIPSFAKSSRHGPGSQPSRSRPSLFQVCPRKVGGQPLTYRGSPLRPQ
jgi:pimeloyl-ACP methyl ester carboxylesterase